MFRFLILLSCALLNAISTFADHPDFLRISRANREITQGHYFQTYQLFKAAKFSSMLMDDLSNYVALALINKDEQQAVLVAEVMAKRGVGKAFFSKELFVPLRGNPMFQELLENADGDRQNITAKSEYLVRMVDSLHEVDQRLAVFRRDHYSGKAIPQPLIDSFDNNAKAMLEVAQRYGIPSEPNVPPELYQDTLIYYKDKFQYIVIHNLQMSKNLSLNQNWKNFLLQESRSNPSIRYVIFHMEELSSIVGKSLGKNEFYMDETGKFWQLRGLSNTQKKEIDNNRKELYLPTISETMAQDKFSRTNRLFTFKSSISFKFLAKLSAEEYQRFMSSYSLVE